VSFDLAHLFQPLAGAPLDDLEIHVVGGAVRDARLGITPHDMDYVVIGACPDTLIERGCQPVGQDFPVFLHPVSHVELALARTERKTTAGHTGFQVHADPTVTLEMDLKRRDFTINAMAVSRDGTLTDPYGGEDDLEARQLRQVSDAFAEDPLRVLRGARFCAQLGAFGFEIEATTCHTMQQMVHRLGELSVERVTREVERILESKTPEIGLNALQATGAQSALFPELPVLPERFVSHHPTVRLAEWILANPLSEAELTAWCQQHRLSTLKRQVLTALHRLAGVHTPSAECIVETLQRIGWLRGNPPDAQLDALLLEADQAGLSPIPVVTWIHWRTRARQVSTAPLIAQGLSGHALGAALHAERVSVLSTEISAPGTAPGL
jgi:tRNA nucleotidyltransferase (CCA-adding enzyme)